MDTTKPAVALPQAVKVEKKPKFVALYGGWFLGKSPDGKEAIILTNGLRPDDPKSMPSIAQLEPGQLQAALDKLKQLNWDEVDKANGIQHP